MKKFISLLLILMFSFGMVSTVKQEKTEAASIALGYAAFKIGVSFTAFATYATWFYANGYHMEVSELITSFANKYYDYSMGVYTEKPTKINVLDKLNLYTSAVLSGNVANIPNAFDLQAIRDDVITEFPQKVNLTDFQFDDFYISRGTTSVTSFPNSLISEQYPFYYDGITVFNQGFYEIHPALKGKVIKLALNETYPSYFAYFDLNNYGWVQLGTYYYPTIRVIDPSGRTYKVILEANRPVLRVGNLNTTDQTVKVGIGAGNSSTLPLDRSFTIFRDNYVFTDDPLGLYTTAENTYSQGTADWSNPYPVYYPALNNKAATADDLLNLMNVDEYLQREIAKMIEEQDRSKETSLVLPEIGVDGMITYPGTETIPENPDIPYNPGSTWYENLFNKVGAIPDLFIGGITDLWDNTLVPKLDNIRDSILDIPKKLDLIWDWIINFPDLIYDFFVPTLPAISETWQPVTDLFNQKIFPVIQPFQNIGFYEEELQDISADIKIGQYQGNHKIIDYSYLKSVRAPIKSVIRSFFWILIIFFNLDQVHRLIRNQSIVKTYIRKVDEPGGNK